jgi:hypothetical protein
VQHRSKERKHFEGRVTTVQQLATWPMIADSQKRIKVAMEATSSRAGATIVEPLAIYFKRLF